MFMENILCKRYYKSEVYIYIFFLAVLSCNIIYSQ
jgi:hypothetical protein